MLTLPQFASLAGLFASLATILACLIAGRGAVMRRTPLNMAMTATVLAVAVLVILSVLAR